MDLIDLKRLAFLLTQIFATLAEYSYPSYRSEVDNNEEIPIGLITDQYHEEMGIVFDYAIEMANDGLEIPLRAVKNEVDYGNSFQAYGTLCQMFKDDSVSGVFGPSSKHTAAHLMTVCDSEDIPYVYSQMSENSEGFNLHPHPLDLARALHSILTTYEWSRFIFLYESAEYLQILNGLLSLFGNDGPTILVLRYDMQLNGDYKTVLKRVRKSPDNQIVVVGSTDTMPEFLRQAQQVGIITDAYKYIIGNLDFHSFDLEEYKHSEANITGIRMFSPEQEQVQNLLEKLGHSFSENDIRNGSCPITIEMALTYDAVQLFAETTKHLSFKPAPIDCSDHNEENVRSDGSTFKNYMRSQDLQENTLTGRLYFEGNVRKGYTFDVIELQPSGIMKIGSWDEVKNFTIQRLAPAKSLYDNFDMPLNNKTFVVLLSVPNKPYSSIVESHKKLEGNSQFEGYGVDLIKELADKLGFNFTLVNGGSDYGTFNKTNNASTGMLREILEGRADLAVTDLTITAERQEAIDFSIPFMNLGIAILYVKPQKEAPSLFSFMDPFSKEVWIYLGLAFLGVSLSFFILGRLSPTEWDNPIPCQENPTELENQFTIGNSMWFSTGALLQQGSEIAPKAVSTRIVASIWWFFTLLMVSSYTANLAAFLTVQTPTSLINNIDELSENKDGVQFGCKKTGSTRMFFTNNGEDRYKRMNKFMISHDDLLTEGNLEGVEKVDKYYAFLMESTSIEYNMNRNCNLTMIGSALDEKGYGIGMPKNWQYRDRFNAAILELQEQGVLAKMKNKWWKEVGAGICSADAEDTEAEALNMDNLKGVYFVLIVGSFLALIYGMLTWFLFVYKKAKQHSLPLRSAFTDELKITLNCSTHVRQLKTPAPSRHSSKSVESIEPENNSIGT